MTRTLIAILRLSSQNVSLVQKESLTHCNIRLDMEEGEEHPAYVLLEARLNTANSAHFLEFAQVETWFFNYCSLPQV